LKAPFPLNFSPREKSSSLRSKKFSWSNYQQKSTLIFDKNLDHFRDRFYISEPQQATVNKRNYTKFDVLFWAPEYLQNYQQTKQKQRYSFSQDRFRDRFYLGVGEDCSTQQLRLKGAECTC